jgi:hypothetical protein
MYLFIIIFIIYILFIYSLQQEGKVVPVRN